jgi:hypothetical protein
MNDVERKLADKCALFGLPPNFDTLMRHMERNHAATVGVQRSHIESLERKLRGAVAALHILADHTEWWLHSQEHEPMPHPVDVLEAAVRAPDHGGSDA